MRFAGRGGAAELLVQTRDGFASGLVQLFQRLPDELLFLVITRDPLESARHRFAPASQTQLMLRSQLLRRWLRRFRVRR